MTYQELKLYLNEIILHLSVEELVTNPRLSGFARRLEELIWKLRLSGVLSGEIKAEFNNLIHSISHSERRKNQDLNQTILLVRNRIQKLA